MLSIIAAYDLNRCIGKMGRIPWHIPGEQQRFRALTLGHDVLIGRKSYEEIGHPLPHRRCIILTRQAEYQAPGCLVAHSLEDAFKLSRSSEIFVAGGAEIYALTLPLAEKLYLTQIHAAFDGDSFFPEFDEKKYSKHLDAEIDANVPYTYYTYVKRTSNCGNPL